MTTPSSEPSTRLLVIGYGINWALQDLEVDEINALLS